MLGNDDRWSLRSSGEGEEGAGLQAAEKIDRQPPHLHVIVLEPGLEPGLEGTVLARRNTYRLRPSFTVGAHGVDVGVDGGIVALPVFLLPRRVVEDLGAQSVFRLVAQQALPVTDPTRGRGWVGAEGVGMCQRFSRQSFPY